jgi:hypothetical protein
VYWGEEVIHLMNMYVGGRVNAPGAYLGDLLEIDGITGGVMNYGNYSRSEPLPDLTFDEHYEGLIYGGGYYGSTWYSDVWTVRFLGSSVTASFVHNFVGDGMVATRNYSVVGDLAHNAFWAVPGFNPSGVSQKVWFIQDGVASSGGGGGAALLAASSTTPTSAARTTSSTSPSQQSRGGSTGHSSVANSRRSRCTLSTGQHRGMLCGFALFSACSSCREGSRPQEFADVYTSDLQSLRDGSVDVDASEGGCPLPWTPTGWDVPWADCTLRITPVEARPPAMPSCGPGQAVLNFPMGSVHETCVYDGWIYEGRGFTRRIRLSDGRVETLTYPLTRNDVAGSWGCNSRGLLFAADHSATYGGAMVAFHDLETPGIVRWNLMFAVPRDLSHRGALIGMRATDVFSSFIVAESEGPQRLYIADSDGQNPRLLDTDVGTLGDFSVDDHYLAFTSYWDVYLYNHLSRRVENLTPGRGFQRFSTVDRNRVAYVEYHSDDPANLDNGNIWMIDLATRKSTAITSQPAQPAAQRLRPVINGDWIVWEDSRNKPVPLPGIGSSLRGELFGFNLRTQREVPLVTGVRSSGYPFIVGNRLYYSCEPGQGQQVNTYFMELPNE